MRKACVCRRGLPVTQLLSSAPRDCVTSRKGGPGVVRPEEFHRHPPAQPRSESGPPVSVYHHHPWPFCAPLLAGRGAASMRMRIRQTRAMPSGHARRVHGRQGDGKPSSQSNITLPPDEHVSNMRWLLSGICRSQHCRSVVILTRETRASSNKAVLCASKPAHDRCLLRPRLTGPGVNDC